MQYQEFITKFRNAQHIPAFTLDHYDRGEFLRQAEADGCVNLGNSLLTIPRAHGLYLTMTPEVVHMGDPKTVWTFSL
jgi:hypothetical protein